MSRFRPQTAVDEQLIVLKPHERPERAEVDDVYVEADKVGVGRGDGHPLQARIDPNAELMEEAGILKFQSTCQKTTERVEPENCHGKEGISQPIGACRN
jgi:hypothetical protein